MYAIKNSRFAQAGALQRTPAPMGGRVGDKGRDHTLKRGFPMNIESIKYNKGLSVCFSGTMNVAAPEGTPPRRIGN
jgi:hypothetical protein